MLLSAAPAADFWVIVTDNLGNHLWNKCYGGTGIDYGHSVAATSDGGYVIAGETSSGDCDVTGHHAGSDYWVVKISGTGSLQWQKDLGGNGSDIPYSILQTSEGNYVVGGFCTSDNGDISDNHGTLNAWIVGLNSTGSLIWEHCYGGNTYEFAQCVIQTADSSLAFVGGSFSITGGEVTGTNNGSYDLWLVKLSGITLTNVQFDFCGLCSGSATASISSGTPPFLYSWSNGSNNDTANNICEGINTITITDSLGNILSGYFFMSESNLNVSMTQTPASCWSCPDGSATVVASGGSGTYSYSWPGHPDTTSTLSGWPHGWVTACVTDTAGCFVCTSIEIQSPVGIYERSDEQEIILFPNPTSSKVTIRCMDEKIKAIQIFNGLGELVLTEDGESLDEKTMSLSRLAPGLYTIEVRTENRTVNKKLIRQ